MSTPPETRSLRFPRKQVFAAMGAALALGAVAGCAKPDGWSYGPRSAYVETDSMGADVEIVRVIASRARKSLEEGSAAVVSERQPGVLFTINDSGNDETLFAIDSTGSDRGAWRVKRARNVDWEAMSRGPCPSADDTASTAIDSSDVDAAIAPGTACLYIGDTGDNMRQREVRTIYRIPEPRALAPKGDATLRAERLDFRYPDDSHDVEAMYVAPDGTTYLITKRPLKTATGALRPALVFSLAPTAWSARDTVTATRVDSLPIVPGSAPLRTITDASLSVDGRWLAVRTYAQLFIFATDSATGRVRRDVAPSACNISAAGEEAGEGLSWIPGTTDLVLTSEGERASLYHIRCPLPGQA